MDENLSELTLDEIVLDMEEALPGMAGVEKFVKGVENGNEWLESALYEAKSIDTAGLCGNVEGKLDERVDEVSTDAAWSCPRS